jgi:hypothetical protein
LSYEVFISIHLHKHLSACNMNFQEHWLLISNWACKHFSYWNMLHIFFSANFTNNWILILISNNDMAKFCRIGGLCKLTMGWIGDLEVVVVTMVSFASTLSPRDVWGRCGTSRLMFFFTLMKRWLGGEGGPKIKGSQLRPLDSYVPPHGVWFYRLVN